MTKAFYPLIVLLSLVLYTPLLNAQTPTLINREWVDTTGTTPIYSKNYVCATTDGTNFYLLQDTFTTGQQSNYQLVKIDDNGNVLWQTQYNSAGSLNDHGTSIYLGSSYLYATGFAYDSVHNTSVINTLKLDLNGDTIWAVSYAGAYSGYTAPADVVEDDSGNVYVCGTEQTGPSDFAMILLKYDSSHNLLWKGSYDSAGLYNGAVSMVLNPGSNIAITGFSGSAFSSWDFESILFGLDGTQLSTARTANASGSFSQPVSIIRDPTNSFIVVGTAASNPGYTQIKLVKYDSTLTQLWVQTYGDSTHNETASDAYNDGNGNLVVCGTADNSSGGKNMVIASFRHHTGNLSWAQQISAPDPTKEASAVAITQDNNANGYVVGRVFNGTNFGIKLISLDQNGNTNFITDYNTPGADNAATAILLDNQNDIYVAGSSAVGTDTSYIGIKYAQLALSNQVFEDSTGNPIYLQGQLIFKIDTSAVKRSVVDDYKINFGDVYTFLQDWAADSLLNILPSDFLKNCTIARIYTGLKTTYTTSISRMGEPIPIPPLWNTFLLIYAPGSNSDTAICNALKQHFPFIKYAELDLLANVNSVVPDDLLYEGSQLGLHPNSTYQHADINVEQAWAYTTGKQTVRIGIFDTGILWTDEDFGYDGVHTSSSVVKGGYDFYTGTDILTETNPDPDGHGTACAGIIGAVRNNHWGIAGIAGGDLDTLNSSGVSLYGFRISDEYPLPNGTSIPAHNYINALIQSCLDIPDSSFGYKLHAINNSYEFGTSAGNAGYDSIGNFNSIRDAIHLAYRNKVVLGFSTGNDGNPSLKSPSNIDDNWVISVGGTGFNGNYKQYVDPSDPNYFNPNYGYGLDISAPSTTGLVISLDTSGSIYGKFAGFDGTSAACPQVIGVAGLLYSYLNDSNPSYNNLAPEDVEYLIEHSAFNTDTPGYNLLCGWGRLNAGGALYLVDTSQRKLHHYDSDSLSSITTVSYAFNIGTLNITEQVSNITDSLFPPGNYIADVYKASCNMSLPLSSTDTIRAYWARPSSSFLFPLAPANDTLMPHERLSIDSINSATAFVSGYLYHLFNSNGQSVGWLPMDTTEAQTTNFAISVLVGQPIVPIWDSIFDTLVYHVTVLEENDFKIKAYPNAVNDIQQLDILFNEPGQEASINLYDISGRQIMSIFNGMITQPDIKLTVNLSALQSGTYFYAVSCQGLKGKQLKIIKI